MSYLDFKDDNRPEKTIENEYLKLCSNIYIVNLKENRLPIPAHNTRWFRETIDEELKPLGLMEECHFFADV